MLPEIGFGDVFDFFAKVFDLESESGRYASDPTHAKIWQLKAYSEDEARNDKGRWTAAGLTVAHHSELPLTEGDKATHAWVARDGSDQPMRQAFERTSSDANRNMDRTVPPAPAKGRALTPRLLRRTLGA